MMGIKTIYFKNEIEEKLKQEKNMSGLINQLLEEHYSKNNKQLTKEEVIKKEKEIAIKKEEIVGEDKYLEQAKKNLSDAEKIEFETSQAIEKKKLEKFARVKKNMEEIYGQPISDKDVVEYLAQLEYGKVANMWEFLEKYFGFISDEQNIEEATKEEN